ncbi:MAG: transposase [Deltaproteobacteria bacterium]|nr:transposase [Deltaproteobacteria bacterium]
MILDDHSTFHITWQCHNKDWLLAKEWAKSAYYDLLLRYKKRYKVQIYSYCFLDNHPHLSGYCESKELLSDFFRLVNSCFARLYNKKNQRRGQVVMDRFKSPRIQTDADLLKVMHYIDLNPKRAGMVSHPKDYAWSSYAYYAYGKADPLIDPAPIYLELAKTPKARQKAYREMVAFILENDWKEKRPYSSSLFIGNPQWVAQKTQALKKAKQFKYQLWKKNFKAKFANSA